jgi:hypothetical protein
MTQTRRLAAILAADIAGYSRLIGADESGTLQGLKAIREELIDPAIATHHGRLVKTTGDGLLIEFGSAFRRYARDVAPRRLRVTGKPRRARTSSRRWPAIVAATAAINAPISIENAVKEAIAAAVLRAVSAAWRTLFSASFAFAITASTRFSASAWLIPVRAATSWARYVLSEAGMSPVRSPETMMRVASERISAELASALGRSERNKVSAR